MQKYINLYNQAISGPFGKFYLKNPFAKSHALKRIEDRFFKQGFRKRALADKMAALTQDEIIAECEVEYRHHL